MVERGLPHAVEDELPRVVEQELPEEIDAVESSIPYPDADPTNRCRESANMIKRISHRLPRRVLRVRFVVVTEVISVLVGDGDDNVARVREVEVARPPRDAASITQLPGLSWKRDLKRGGIEQVCVIVPEVAASVAAAELDVHASASDTQMRPKEAEPKTARDARFADQSLPALEASGNPVAPLAREFIQIFPEKVPAVLPPNRGVRHEIDLTPGVKYCVTRQWPLPRDQTEAVDAFFESRRQGGHVRESVSPHSSPTFCVKKATGGWRIVHAFNKLNDTTIPAQTPIPRKDIVLDTMSGSTQYSAIDLMNGLYQILMRDNDVPLTAVSMPNGMLWE
ncbi:hypothetical protein PC118_g21184 [Phytophthora cactorum]|uniref:Reverse transcriptase n=1 Tax=Phytophthora cactorum TaxID=29920 RepID=A0A8T1EWM1_9STRA|nr:hypothetical protein PC118_g21184 [Phytophthora cactorum]KAG3050190.1 hypothetical protein PC122_g23317 [Phytophthora cactorum]